MLKLQLDTNALMHMFPENSEAYLHLQQSVLTEAARRCIKTMAQDKLTTNLREIAYAYADQVTKDLQEHYTKASTGYLRNKIELSQPVLDSIKSKAQDAITEATEKSVDKASRYFIDNDVFTTRIKTEVDKYIVNLIKDSKLLDELISKAITEKLSKL